MNGGKNVNPKDKSRVEANMTDMASKITSLDPVELDIKLK